MIPDATTPTAPRRRRPFSAFPLGALALVPVLAVLPRPAAAQYGQPMGMGGPGAPPPSDDKPEGPAEEAPEEDRPADLAPLSGYADQRKRRTQVFVLDGYLRLRTDYMHNFFLGQGYTDTNDPTNPGKPPFPWPTECGKRPTSEGCRAKNVGAANMRMRLEPSFNITDLVRVSSQIDVLDNTLMGSTPDSLVGLDRGFTDRAGRAPLPSLYGTQDPPEIGQNGYQSSIRAKRAWAEVDGEFGSLRFGRMPWHFGRGIAYNAGACADCDFGTTVDRIMALTQAYGHQLALAYDFASQGQTSGTVKFGRNDPGAYPIDLSQRDDVIQMMASMTRIDEPSVLRERIDRGDLVVNYGLQLVYRSQSSDVAEPIDDGTGVVKTGNDLDREDVTLRRVNALLFQPDLWFKLGWRALTVEFESTAVLGTIDDATPLVQATGDDKSLTLKQMGWVLASELNLYRNAFFIGFETGGATGDAAYDKTQYLNYRWRFAQQPAGDHTMSEFKFSPDYHVDQILFRRIFGTVNNALYFKPALAYWLDLGDTRQLGLSAAFIYSLPLVPGSTPGNDGRGYGLEMDLGATYRNEAEGFYAGLTWGVLWPLWDLDRSPTDGVRWPVDTVGADASSAQVLRTFLGVKF